MSVRTRGEAARQSDDRGEEQVQRGRAAGSERLGADRGRGMGIHKGQGRSIAQLAANKRGRLSGRDKDARPTQGQKPILRSDDGV